MYTLAFLSLLGLFLAQHINALAPRAPLAERHRHPHDASSSEEEEPFTPSPYTEHYTTPSHISVWTVTHTVEPPMMTIVYPSEYRTRSIETVIQTVTQTMFADDASAVESVAQATGTEMGDAAAAPATPANVNNKWQMGQKPTCQLDYVQYVPGNMARIKGVAVSWQVTETVTDTLECSGCALMVESKTGRVMRGMQPRGEAGKPQPMATTSTAAAVANGGGTVAPGDVNDKWLGFVSSVGPVAPRDYDDGKEEEAPVTVTVTMPITTQVTQVCKGGEPVFSAGAPNTMPLHTWDYRSLERRAVETGRPIGMHEAMAKTGGGMFEVEEENEEEGSGSGEVDGGKQNGIRWGKRWRFCDFWITIC